MPRHPMTDEQKLELLEQVRELLTFPDIDDDEYILAEAMKLLQINRGVNTELTTK